MNTDLEQMLKAKYISPEKIIQIIKEYNAETNEYKRDSLRDIIISNNIRLVAKVAHKYSGKSDIDDYFQNGIMGLLKALEKFDPNRDIKFSTYAMFWVKKYMQDEQAKDLVVHVPKSADNTKALSHGSFIDLDNNIGDSNLTWNEIIKDQRAFSPEEITLKDKAKSRLMDAINNLKPNQAEVIRLRYFSSPDETKTLENVGKIMGLTRERVRQIEKSASEILRNNLNGLDF